MVKKKETKAKAKPQKLVKVEIAVESYVYKGATYTKGDVIEVPEGKAKNLVDVQRVKPVK